MQDDLWKERKVKTITILIIYLLWLAIVIFHIVTGKEASLGVLCFIVTLILGAGLIFGFLEGFKEKKRGRK